MCRRMDARGRKARLSSRLIVTDRRTEAKPNSAVPVSRGEKQAEDTQFAQNAGRIGHFGRAGLRDKRQPIYRKASFLQFCRA